MNVNLGVPYEAILRRIIEKGYAGNQTEAIRQALVEFDRKIKDEELVLVEKGVEYEMQRIKSGAVKTHTLEDAIKRKVFE
ncbi:hypothetical protein AUJ17_00200 [Candidatus Micrarchaeota archaeon CG1_02_47_40]|nr:MAG: hypothetical protein AUJ17_00200 [Candidatus Micrarchaeota archaeon CG1_02_47_40]